MTQNTYNHLIEIDEENRLLTIYCINGSSRDLYTSVNLPEMTWDKNPDEIRDFCRTLGENIILDSPQARKLFGI